MRHVFMIIAFVVTLVGCGIGQNYDALIGADQFCQQKWADYEADLQRRSDLIPNITAAVQAEAGFEQNTLTAVTQARAAATSVQLKADDFSDPQKVAQFNAAQNQLHGSLSRLMVASERYPDLKANAGFHDLRITLEGTENRILRSRQEYNKAVGSFNTELGKIHGQVTNAVTGHPFQARLYFQADESAKTAPNVAQMLAPVAQSAPAPVVAAAAPAPVVAAPVPQPTIVYVQAPVAAPQYAPQQPYYQPPPQVYAPQSPPPYNQQYVNPQAAAPYPQIVPQQVPQPAPAPSR